MRHEVRGQKWGEGGDRKRRLDQACERVLILVGNDPPFRRRRKVKPYFYPTETLNIITDEGYIRTKTETSKRVWFKEELTGTWAVGGEIRMWLRGNSGGEEAGGVKSAFVGEETLLPEAPWLQKQRAKDGPRLPLASQSHWSSAHLTDSTPLCTESLWYALLCVCVFAVSVFN